MRGIQSDMRFSATCYNIHMNIDPKLKNEIKDIVFKYLDSSNTKAFMFGSRVTGTNSKFSDIDLGLESNAVIPYELVLNIEEEFTNSNIHYSVDVVDFSKVSDKFKTVAKQNVMYLN